MKKHIFIICFTLIFTAIYSQEIGFQQKQSEGIRMKMSNWVIESRELGMIDNFAYFLMKPYEKTYSNEIMLGTQNHFIYKCDLNNNIIKATELLLEHDKKELDFEKAIMVQNKIFVFSSFQNKRDKKHYLFAQNYNTAAGELTNNINIAAELDYSGYSKFNNTIFDMEVSPDGSKILVFYSLLNKSNEIIRSGFNIYDNEMNLLWNNKNVSAQFSGGYFEFSKFSVSNAGEVYLLGQHYKAKENYWENAKFSSRGFLTKDTYFVDMPNYNYILYHYTNKTDKVEEYTFELPKKFIRNINIQPSESGNVICSGFYSDPKKVSVVGSFYFELNMALQSVENLSTMDFSKEMLTKDLSQEELNRYRRSINNKQEWDPYSYIIGDVKTKQNGDSYFIAEQYLYGIKKQVSGNTVYYLPIHIYNDLFIVNLNKENQISRIDKITKRQYWLVDDKFSSYASFEKNNNLYFLFNTFEKKDTFFKNLEISDSYIVKLDENGIQKNSIFKKKKEDDKLPIPSLKYSINTQENTVVFGAFPISLKHRELIFQQITITE